MLHGDWGFSFSSRIDVDKLILQRVPTTLFVVGSSQFLALAIALLGGMAAAEAARCREFIEALPSGFATIVGDRGTRLSGGQRQRIAIARALLKDSPIVLLDEATSSLDGESEELIRQALDRLMRDRTVIASAHRLSTLRSFDRIVVLDRGHVTQDGSPEELLRRDGPYRSLMESELARLRQAA